MTKIAAGRAVPWSRGRIWPSLPPRKSREAKAMKRLLLGTVLSLALAAPAFAALKPGDTAPDFQVKAAKGGTEFDFHLKDALKKGPVVLYFFPAAFTPGCTAEAHAFAEATDDF